MLNREIKFRCWDVKQKAMFPIQKMEFSKVNGELHHLSGVDIHHKDSDYEGDVYYGGHALKLTGSPPVQRYLLMQYIGLKDRSGKEFYEGDIIQHKTAAWKGVIKYEEGSYKVETSFSKWTLNSLRVEKTEIIGNIYQNPELLEAPDASHP